LSRGYRPRTTDVADVTHERQNGTIGLLSFDSGAGAEHTGFGRTPKFEFRRGAIGEVTPLAQVQVQTAIEGATQCGVHELRGVVIRRISARTWSSNEYDTLRRAGPVIDVDRGSAGTVRRRWCDTSTSAGFPIAEIVLQLGDRSVGGDISRDNELNIGRAVVCLVEVFHIVTRHRADLGRCRAARIRVARTVQDVQEN